MKDRAAEFQQHLTAGLLLCGVVLLCYANSFHAGLLMDSRLLILRDPRVQAVSAGNLASILKENYWSSYFQSGLYRPLTTLSYLFNYAVLRNGEAPAGYHAVNLLLHAANAVMAYFAALAIWKKTWPAFFTAAIFAAHPANTEAVTNVVGRADLLAGAAVLSGFQLYVKSGAVEGARKLPWLAALMLVTTCGVFSKESAVVVVGLVALYDFTFRMAPGGVASVARNFWRFFRQGYIAFLPPLAAMWYIRRLVFAKANLPEFIYLDNPLAGAGFWTSRLTAVKVLGKSLALAAWPRTLSCDYSYNQIPVLTWRSWQAGIALAALAAVGWLAIRCYRRRPPLFFFGMFTLVALLPTANLVVTIGSIFSERFLYLATIGFGGCVVSGVYALSRRETPAAAVLSLLVVTLGARAIVRNGDWRDDAHLWTAAAKASPNSFKTHLGVAAALQEEGPNRGNIERIVQESEKALAITEALPLAERNAATYTTLAIAYWRKGDLTGQSSNSFGMERLEAETWYRRSLSVLLQGVAADRARQDALRSKELARGRAPEEIRWSGDAALHSNLALLATRLDDYDTARSAYLALELIMPTTSNVYANLAGVYAQLGSAEQASAAYLEAMILSGPSRELLESALYRRLDPQGCAWSQAKLNPDCPWVKQHLCPAAQDLLEILRRTGWPDRAKEIRQRAIEEFGCQAAQLR